MVKRRDGKRIHVKLTRLTSIKKALDQIQYELLVKSKKFLQSSVVDAGTLAKLKEDAKKGGFIRANWCGSAECEKLIKGETGAEIRGTLYGKDETPFAACVHCGKEAKHVVYIAKAY